MFQWQGETKLEIYLSPKHLTQVSFRVLLSSRQVCSDTKNSKPAWEIRLQAQCILALPQVWHQSAGWQQRMAAPSSSRKCSQPLAQAVSLLFSCCKGAQKVALLPPLPGRAHNRDYWYLHNALRFLERFIDTAKHSVFAITHELGVLYHPLYICESEGQILNDSPKIPQQTANLSFKAAPRMQVLLCSVHPHVSHLAPNLGSQICVLPSLQALSLPGKFHFRPPSPTAESQLQGSASVSIWYKGLPDYLLNFSSPVFHALKQTNKQKSCHCSLLSVVFTVFTSACGLQSLEECLIVCGMFSIKWLSNWILIVDQIK